MLNRKTMRSIKIILPVGLFTILTACGGGGGGGDNVNRSTVNDHVTPDTGTTTTLTNSSTASATNSSPSPASNSRPSSVVNTAGNASGNSAMLPSGNGTETRPAAGAPSTAASGGMSGSARPPGLIAGTGTSSATSREPGWGSGSGGGIISGAGGESGDIPPAVADAETTWRAGYSGKVVSVDDDFMHVAGLSYSDSIAGNQTDLFTIAVDKDRISVTFADERVKNKLEDFKKDIKELKDIDGSLLAYYGWVSAVSVEKNDRITNSIAGAPYKYALLNLFYAIDQDKAKLPANPAVYVGEFIYTKPGGTLLRTASSAEFSYKDKTIDGSIRDSRGGTLVHWYIDGDKTVHEDGTFNVRLIANTGGMKSGSMQGGFFGEQGQVLAAKAESDGREGNDGGNDEWAAILIAKPK